MRLFLASLLFAGVLGASAAETESLYLSGHGSDDAQPWDFYCTAGRNSGFWTKIAVPSCWEQQGFGAYDYGMESRPSRRMPNMPAVPEEQGIYRREFSVPATWRGRVVRLVFEGVMTDTEVKINGQPAGAMHQGSFYQFKYDITDKLRYDASNLLEVTVSKHSANDSVNRAERLGDYWNFGGIFRPVRLEALPAQAIDRVAIDAKADGSFVAEVHLGGAEFAEGRAGPLGPPKGPDGPAVRPYLEVVIQLKNLDGTPVGAAVATPVPAGAKQLTVHVAAKDPATWSAETPNLYLAEFTLRAGGAATHTVTQRFGFRTFELRAGDGLYVNGHKITMRGICRHSFWPETGRTLSLERQREDVRLIKEANMNAVRMSHYPPDAGFLDLCDEAGLYVLDELGGWQAHYDTPTGRKLIAEMVPRDVNHPSILFWDNGNEGGENPEVDDEFAKYDPQHRPVLHPWSPSFRGMNTRHYREFADTVKFSEGPEIYMPTEFLHGLYDGGLGAGLDDFWKYMGEKPHAAGGFLWVWADEGIVRTDLDGRVDVKRDLAPDGLVGPHHEKEGSYYAVRDIWSPVQVPLAALPADFAGAVPVRNRYDFNNLSGVTFEWQLIKYAPPGAWLVHRTLVAHGRLAGPDLAARTDGTLKLTLPADWRDADVLTLRAIDSRQREIDTWSWRWKSGVEAIGRAVDTKAAVDLADEGGEIIVTSGRNAAHFNKATGKLAGLERDGRRISLANGPRLTAYKRTERSFAPLDTGSGKLLKLDAVHERDTVVVTATYEGALHTVRWTLAPDGDLTLDYEFAGPGVVDILGVDFDYPEEKLKSKEWFGNGPYRIWQNRMRGVTLARWDTNYNDTQPGISWDYPEFKGWFSQWEWMAFSTSEGRFAFLNGGGQPYVGAYSPRDGKNNPVLNIPRLGLGVYQAITGIGTKGSLPSNLGPQGQPQNITGNVKGTLVIRLLDQP